MSGLDLPDNCWTAPIGDLAIGDVCEAIPLAVLCEDRLSRLVASDDEGGDLLVPVLHSYGLIVRIINNYALVAAVGTLAGVDDADLFDRLVESGREGRTHIRIPSIPDDPYGAWDGRDGVVMLSQLESFAVEYELLRRRVAAMNDDASERLQRRVARAFEVR